MESGVVNDESYANERDDEPRKEIVVETFNYCDEKLANVAENEHNDNYEQEKKLQQENVLKVKSKSYKEVEESKSSSSAEFSMSAFSSLYKMFELQVIRILRKEYPNIPMSELMTSVGAKWLELCKEIPNFQTVENRDEDEELVGHRKSQPCTSCTNVSEKADARYEELKAKYEKLEARNLTYKAQSDRFKNKYMSYKAREVRQRQRLKDHTEKWNKIHASYRTQNCELKTNYFKTPKTPERNTSTKSSKNS